METHIALKERVQKLQVTSKEQSHCNPWRKDNFHPGHRNPYSKRDLGDGLKLTKG